jgi:hypothetical protein
MSKRHHPPSYFYLKQRFGDGTVPPSSGKMPTQLGPVDNVSPYFRTPEPTQGMIYKPHITQTICGSKTKFLKRHIHEALIYGHA